MQADISVIINSHLDLDFRHIISGYETVYMCLHLTLTEFGSSNAGYSDYKPLIPFKMEIMNYLPLNFYYFCSIG